MGNKREYNFCMSLRKVSLVQGEYYHIYNRGNDKKEIFLDDEDRSRFVKLLYLCNSVNGVNFREDVIRNKIDAFDFEREERIVSIGAYCLMPNHFHLYLTIFPNSTKASQGKALGSKEKDENEISAFIGKLCTSYTMYFNKKHERRGSLFEGKFKSVNVDGDVQARYLFSYIHLNPIKLFKSDWKERGVDSSIAINFLNSYKWSSYFDFLGIQRKENRILNIEDFPDFFSGKKEEFEKEIFDWIKKDEE